MRAVGPFGLTVGDPELEDALLTGMVAVEELLHDTV